MSFGASLAGELTLAEIIIGLVISFILLSIWQKVFDNFFYGTLGIDKTSSYETFILAIAVTISFFILIAYINTFAEGIVLGVVQPSSGSAAHTFIGGTENTIVEEKQPCEEEYTCKQNKKRKVYVRR